MAVFAVGSIAKILHTFPQGLKLPIKSDNSLHMCAHLVQEGYTVPCNVEVWAARIMGGILLSNLFHALYFVRNVSCWRECVGNVRAHLIQFIWYLLDE